MLTIRINRKPNGVPILSREKINEIGEALVDDFCPKAMKTPQALDVDLFAEQYLHLSSDYQFLSHCGVYLGMTVFNNTNQLIVYDPALNKAKYISAKAGTIIIDNSLLEEGKEHRYRFTMGHEAPGHAFLHREYFSADPNQRSPFTPATIAQVQCRVDTARLLKGKPRKQWTDRDWMEWQANEMSSAFLMPRAMVNQVVHDLRQELGVHYCEQHEKRFAYQAVSRVAEIFNVSFQAANFRLKNLGLIRSLADQNSDGALDWGDFIWH